LNVPSQIADFFIEVLAVDQPAATRQRALKIFRKPLIMRIRLPEPIPMQFSSPDPDRTRIGFFDSDLESAAALERRVSRALSVIARRRLLTAEFHSVDSAAVPDIARLAAAHRVPVLRLDCDSDATTDTVTFVLRILQTRWDSALRGAIESAIRADFAAAEILFCAKCDLMYCASDGGPCVLRYHEGRRLPFDDGRWEVAENNVALWNFACCGRIARDAPGCAVRTDPQHLREVDRAFSRLVISDVAVYDSV
jgi:hypothetical protein